LPLKRKGQAGCIIGGSKKGTSASGPQRLSKRGKNVIQTLPQSKRPKEVGCKEKGLRKVNCLKREKEARSPESGLVSGGEGVF